MAELKQISLPHGTIPTQMFGNVNLQNAMMYVNDNFAAVKSGTNDAIVAIGGALEKKADSDHAHDSSYAPLSHKHGKEEVTGLQTALDGKAELNHEHSQYLSSLPAHYHGMTDVQGLSESLTKKAEATHSHKMSQIDGLSTELGVKASTAYVDQQVSSVGSTIKPIVDSEIPTYASDKTDATKVPKDIIAKPNAETAAQKMARIGVSEKYAREDHKHAFDSLMDQSPVDNKIYPSDALDPYPYDFGFEDWTSGGEHGVEISAYVMLSEYDGSRFMMPIIISITKNGIVSSVKKSTEDVCLPVTF